MRKYNLTLAAAVAVLLISAVAIGQTPKRTGDKFLSAIETVGEIRGAVVIDPFKPSDVYRLRLVRPGESNVEAVINPNANGIFSFNYDLGDNDAVSYRLLLLESDGVATPTLRKQWRRQTLSGLDYLLKFTTDQQFRTVVNDRATSEGYSGAQRLAILNLLNQSGRDLSDADRRKTKLELEGQAGAY